MFSVEKSFAPYSGIEESGWGPEVGMLGKYHSAVSGLGEGGPPRMEPSTKRTVEVRRGLLLKREAMDFTLEGATAFRSA